MKKSPASRSVFLPPSGAANLPLIAISALLVLLALVLYPVGIAVAAQSQQTPACIAKQRTLSLAERVAYQRAIEEVYWRHRIWPKERPDAKPSLDEVMPPRRIEQKVTEYLRNSQALGDYWQQPVDAEQLQAEMDRIAEHTRQPEVLRELFTALGNDPFVIAECLARSTLSKRLVIEFCTPNQKSKERFESWRAKAENQMPRSFIAPAPDYTLPTISDTANKFTEGLPEATNATNAGATSSCANDSWADTGPTNAPNGRSSHTAVWTGTEMIVWGGYDGAGYLNTGGKYDPSTDSWTAASTTNAPTGRSSHTAVWTGSEMIVWGGFDGTGYLSTGGKYDPSTDSWTATSTTNAPTGRSSHTAVWTGREMIVWGGFGGSYLNTGGRYNPGTDSWTATSPPVAPSPRRAHTAVWTGSEMIVWGGQVGDGSVSNTGGRYDPNTNSWDTAKTNTTTAPAGRTSATAVWTGIEMIVWGGQVGDGSVSNTGGRYNPSRNNWIATSTVLAPAGRNGHTAVWTGHEMIVWGGSVLGGYSNTGGRYDPSVDNWTALDATNTPLARGSHTAVWTGREMIVWGGVDGSAPMNTGGRYCAQPPPPTDNTWTGISTTNAPSGRFQHTAVWTGSEMIVWGGAFDADIGGKYNPATDSWTPTSSTNAPSNRGDQTAIWTGTEMIVWGGYFYDGNANFLNTGGRYNPDTDNWTTTSTTNVPAGRYDHTAVWTGSEMIVWGGSFFTSSSYYYFNTGGRYNPATDSWLTTSTINAPTARDLHTATWTGSEMIVWGGADSSILNTGGRYDPTTNSWKATSTINAPSSRAVHTAIWTGSEMIVWGGDKGEPMPFLNTGGRYNPSADSWTATNTTNAPVARTWHATIWTGSEMIVWGGYQGGPTPFLDSGGRYNPTTNSWTPTSITNPPSFRYHHKAVWTGSEMIVWGGQNGNSLSSATGGRYCAQVAPTPTSTPEPTPTPPFTTTISGTISYCSNPAPGPVPNATLTLTGSSGGSTLSDGSGNYTFAGLVLDGSFTVTPTKATKMPGSQGINTLDAIAVQKHFLGSGIIPQGCRLTAANVTPPAAVNTLDVIAIQKFFLGQTSGIGNVGKYQFSPLSRSYSPLGSTQTDQNFDALIFGDVAAPFITAPRPGGPSQDAAGAAE